MEISLRNVSIFKIRNRRGYACTCLNCLTEGKTPYEAYLRMRKAIKRNKGELRELSIEQTRKILRKR